MGGVVGWELSGVHGVGWCGGLGAEWCDVVMGGVL